MNLSTIAEMAKVSTSTVSRALLGRPGVSEKLRTRIKDLSIEFGIKPQPGRQQARKMRTKYLKRSDPAQLWLTMTLPELVKKRRSVRARAVSNS